MNMDKVYDVPASVDLWDLYLCGGIQYAADCWPTTNFLAILFSESTHRVEVLDRTQVNSGILSLRVTGECYDGICSFDYDLTRPDLDRAQKYRLLELIKVCYPATRDPNRVIPKKAAKTMGILFK